MVVGLMLRHVSDVWKRYPILRGMAAYGVLWPSSNIAEQLLKRREEISYVEAARFGIFGSLYVAPTIHSWVKISSYLIPGQGIKVALKKVLLEQFTYAPFAIASFYIGMTLLEEGWTDWEDAVEEVKEKMIPTMKLGVLYWPLIQTVNFTFVREKNRVMVAGVASFFWALFLSYMKHEHLHQKKET